MNKKSLLRILFLLFVILLNLIVFWKIDYSDIDSEGVKFVVELSSNKDDDYQIYYSKAGGDFVDANSCTAQYRGYGNGSETQNYGTGKIETLTFDFPIAYDNLRFDLGQFEGKTVLYSVYFELSGVRYDIPLDQLTKEKNQVGISRREHIQDMDPEMLVIDAGGDDPNILVQFHKDQILSQYNEKNKTKSLVLDIVICAILDLVALYVLIHFYSLIDIPVEIYQNRKLALTLAKNDFKTKYAGSYLGMIWAFIQPIVTIAVYWFVFTVGFRAGTVGQHPFVLFIVVGIIPWFFFSDALNGGTNAMTDYNYLVKKVVFNIDILPFVKVMSAFIVHCFFIGFAIILCCFMGYVPTIYALQLFYYIICNMVFVLGLSYLSSSIVVFFRDLGQFINIFILQVGVWLTPIMWNADNMLSPFVHKLFKINPMYYVVSGFRDSLLDKKWFWEGDTLVWTIYFWVLTILIFGLGVKVFRRLKVHFADVL